MKTIESLPIEELELGVRAYNILKWHGVDSIGDLMKITAEDANEWAINHGHYLGEPGAKQVIAAQNQVKTWKAHTPTGLMSGAHTYDW